MRVRIAARRPAILDLPQIPKTVPPFTIG